MKTATSKTTPSTRPITSAWLETSIAQASTPRSRIIANRPCRSGASGVVSAVFTSTPPTRVPTVPITAAGTPACCRPFSAIRVVVVLPWVPVTPIIRSDRAGSPYTRAAKRPRIRAGPLHDEQGYVGRAGRAGLVGEDRDRARIDRGVGEVDAVRAGPGNGGVHVPGVDPLRAQGDTGGLRRTEVAAGRDQGAGLVQPGHQIGQR